MQVSSTVTRHERKSSSFDLNRFNNALYIDALVAIYSSLRDFGTQRAVSLCISKRSCKVVEMLPCEMCNAFAISSTLIRLLEYTRSRTLLHISSSVASDGRPDLVSSSKDVLLRLNSPTQNLTCAYDGAEDHKHWSTCNVFPDLFSLSNTSIELQHGTQLLTKSLLLHH